MQYIYNFVYFIPQSIFTLLKTHLKFHLPAPQLGNSNFYIMLLGDLVLFSISCVGAYLLRFEFLLSPNDILQIEKLLLILLPIKVLIFFLFGLYQGMWRYTSLHDFWRVIEGSFLSSVLLVVAVLFIFGHTGFSRAVFFLDGVLTFVLTGGARVGIRTLYAAKARSEGVNALQLPVFGPRQPNLQRILIIGAGGSGEKLLREIADNPNIDYKVVGFLDDDPGKKGLAIRGVPVFGPVHHLKRILDKHGIDQILISAPSATGPEMRRIVDLCDGCGVSFRTLPAIGQLLDDKVSIKTLRDVNYEDLLRRPPVRLDAAGIQDYIKGRTIMVTGAGGSIGSELCRQLLRFEPEKLILVDAGEANLYGIQMELRHELRFDAFHTILASVQHQSLMEEVFRTYRPDVVFHAAAYKHVPLLERNPWEAVFNNVLGSQVVMQMAVNYKVKRFVLVSTDKAVRPTNVMGTSKRLSELILQSLQENGTRFMAVRFGNVLASSGSVIPLFRKQIEHGGPVTVTHPEITRYFMTIPEAAQLILQAGAMGNGGELFVLEMGIPVKIADMAVDLIRLSGKEPGRDIEIIFTGLRPGEKLFEELITQGEDIARTSHEKIMTLKYNDRWDWGGLSSQDKFRNWLDRGLEELFRAAKTRNPTAIKEKLKQLVPEYTPQEAECVLSCKCSGKATSFVFGRAWERQSELKEIDVLQTI